MASTPGTYAPSHGPCSLRVPPARASIGSRAQVAGRAREHGLTSM
jgi:hypothetical protein